MRLEHVFVPLALCVALGLVACQNRSTSGEGVQTAEAGTQNAAVPATPGSGAEKTGGKAVFAEREFDFGDVEQDQSITHEFKVRNEGAEVLHIGKVRGS